MNALSPHPSARLKLKSDTLQQVFRVGHCRDPITFLFYFISFFPFFFFKKENTIKYIRGRMVPAFLQNRQVSLITWHFLRVVDYECNGTATVRTWSSPRAN